MTLKRVWNEHALEREPKKINKRFKNSIWQEEFHRLTALNILDQGRTEDLKKNFLLKKWFIKKR